MRTILLFLLLASAWMAGCTSTVVENTRSPVIELSRSGDLLFHGEKLERGRICRTLLRAGVRKGQEVNIRIPPNADRRAMGHIAGELNQGGFTRVIFTTDRTAASTKRNYTGELPVKDPAFQPRQMPHRPR